MQTTVVGHQYCHIICIGGASEDCSWRGIHSGKGCRCGEHSNCRWNEGPAAGQLSLPSGGMITMNFKGMLETPPPSPALSHGATPWVATPTDGYTTTPSLSVKLVACWLLISWGNQTLVLTAVRWPTLLDWVVMIQLPLSLEVSVDIDL